mgnify:CR=1 FL=1
MIERRARSTPVPVPAAPRLEPEAETPQQEWTRDDVVLLMAEAMDSRRDEFSTVQDLASYALEALAAAGLVVPVLPAKEPSHG